MNRDDSAEMARLLRGLGMAPASSDSEADLVHINTCCVRQKAEDKFFSYLGVQRYRKRDTGAPVIGVSGCIPGKQDIRAGYKFVDYVVGAKHPQVYAAELAELLRERFPALGASDAPPPGSPPSAFHTVIRGCSNFCTYCVVPYVRGPEISEPPEKLRDEIAAKADAGAREITLLGQNVLAYGYDLEPRRSLLDVIEPIHDLPGLDRIRFVTSHPAWVKEDFLAGISGMNKVCEHFHVPFQSGDDDVLRRMNRGYDSAYYIEMIDMIRSYFPGAGITADAIVGFPGETRRNFDNTLKLIDRVRADNIYSFMYSPRPLSEARHRDDDVPDAEKKRRLAELNELEDRISRGINEALIGGGVEVMIESKTQGRQNRYHGRTRTSKLADLECGRGLCPGDVVTMRVTGATPHGIQGEVAGS